jgi:8-oxo-dGTP diphosphatase
MAGSRRVNGLCGLRPTVSSVHVINAAGGLVWRTAARGLEVILVHRPLRDDWTLPIGRVEPGETLEACALREVAEETGRHCRLGPFIEVLEVAADDAVRRFHIFEMKAVSGDFVANRETDQAPWLAIDESISRATYPNVRELLRSFHAGRAR